MSKNVGRALLLVLLTLPCISPLVAHGTNEAYVQKQPVRHIVVFKYKPGTTPEQIRQVTDAFATCATRFRASPRSKTASTTARKARTWASPTSTR